MDVVKQMLEKAFTTLKLDVKLGIVLWIFTSVTADKGVSFTCHGNQVKGYTCMTMSTQQTCSHGHVMHVNNVHDHKNMKCNSTGSYLSQDESCTKSIEGVCNQRSTCSNFTSPIQTCHLDRCITAFYTCRPRSEALIPTTLDVNKGWRTAATVGRTNPGAPVGGPIRSLATAASGHRPTSAARPSSTVVGSDGDDADEDDGEKSAEKSKDVIIATVGAVVFIIVLGAIVLLLMFFCPMDCPFRRYRARMRLYRQQQQRLSQQQRQQQRQSQQQQQQQQQQQGRGFGSDDEYDYIDVNSMKSLKSRSAGETNNLTAVPLNTLKHTSGYLPAVSPDHNDYFSARESLPRMKTPSLPSPQYSSVVAVPAPSRKYMPSRLEDSKHSDESSCKELNKYGSLPSSKHSAERPNLPAQKEAKMNTLPVSGKQHLNTGLNNGKRPPYLHQLKEDGADRKKDFVIKIGQDRIYDKARPISTSSSSSSSSASTANYEIYHNVTSIDGDYAHLSRHGDEVRIIGNIYN